MRSYVSTYLCMHKEFYNQLTMLLYTFQTHSIAIRSYRCTCMAAIRIYGYTVPLIGHRKSYSSTPCVTTEYIRSCTHFVIYGAALF